MTDTPTERLLRLNAALAKQLRRTAQNEMVLWPILMIPSAGVLLIFTPIVLLAMLALILIAWPVDCLFSLIRPQSTNLPEQSIKRIDALLIDLQARGAIKWNSRRLRVVKSDLQLGAHVRGVIRPSIVISGGMLMGLMRKDSHALGVLAHELAHVAHWDRLYLGVLGLWTLNAAAPFLWGGESSVGEKISVAFISSLIPLGICMIISERREFAADLSAGLVAGFRPYTEVLIQAQGKHGKRSSGFFHPSLKERIEEISTIRPRISCLSPGLTTLYILSGLAAYTSVGLAGVVIPIAGIALEISRRKLRPVDWSIEESKKMDQ